ncbi:MAG: hypothetical protein HY301_03805, partial [Verrucomicrobia bacterium]|nr:hypothetical protein [Verrucomicrobiota bacterium]
MKLISTFLSVLVAAVALTPKARAAADYQLFARTNLVVWCIVPFDAKQRGPSERAAS